MLCTPNDVKRKQLCIRGGGVDKLTKSSNSKIFGGSARDED